MKEKVLKKLRQQLVDNDEATGIIILGSLIDLLVIDKTKTTPAEGAKLTDQRPAAEGAKLTDQWPGCLVAAPAAENKPRGRRKRRDAWTETEDAILKSPTLTKSAKYRELKKLGRTAGAVNARAWKIDILP